MTRLTSRPSRTLRPTSNGVHTGLEQITLRDLLKTNPLCAYSAEKTHVVLRIVSSLWQELVPEHKMCPSSADDMRLSLEELFCGSDGCSQEFLRADDKGPSGGQKKYRPAAQSVICDGSDRLIMCLVCGIANICGGRRPRRSLFPSWCICVPSCSQRVMSYLNAR